MRGLWSEVARVVIAVPVCAGIALGAGSVKLRKGSAAVEVKMDGGLFTRYCFADDEGRPLVRPFLYPVLAADGTPVTSDQAAAGGDHPHHRSIWIGHGDVNGGDHWEKAGPGPGVAMQRQVSGPEVSGDAITHVLEWEDAGGRPVMREARAVRFAALADGTRTIDVRSAYSAVAEAVTLGDTKEAGLCAVRVAAGISADPVITNSGGGTGEDDCWGKPAEWCDISGTIGKRLYGVTIIDHPANPGHPSRWHVRKYGLLAANIFGLAAFEKGKSGKSGAMVIRPGEEAVFLYRVVVHPGAVDGSRIAAAAAAFAGSADPGLRPLLRGTGLEGWRVPSPNLWWSVKGGVLVGENDPGQHGHVLETERSFGDLILETDVRFRGEIDSGIFLRNKQKMQVQIGVSRSLKRDMTCSIYAAGGYPGQARGVAELLKKGDWNRIRIIARGSRFGVWLNGEQVLEYWDESFRDPGPIGLQIHAGVEMKVEFRNLKVKELGG